MARPLHETLFNQAENALNVKGDIQYTRQLLAEATQLYKEHLNSGGTKISAEVFNRYKHLQIDLITRWLSELEVELPVVGSEQTIADLNEFYKEFRSSMRLFRDPADFSKIRDEFIRVRDLATKTQKDSFTTTSKDITEANDLKITVEALSKDLAEAIARGTNWDPREPRTQSDMPLLKLGRAIKALEDLLVNATNSIQEVQLKKDLSFTVLVPAQKLAEELQQRVATIDQPAIDAFKAAADALPVSVAIQDSITKDVNVINDEAVLNSSIIDLQTYSSAVDGFLSSLKPRYSAEVIKELDRLFPEKNIAALEDYYKKYWNDKKKIIDTEILRRQNRIANVREEITSSNEVSLLKKAVYDKMALIDSNEPPAITGGEYDALKAIMDGVYETLLKNKNHLNENEYKALEGEVKLFDYRTTKRALDATLTYYEMSETDFKNFFGEAKRKNVNARVYDRITSIINEAKQNAYPTIDAGLMSEMEKDFSAFRDECNTRITIYTTEQSMDTSIWWNGQEGQKASRGVPQGASPFWGVDQAHIPKIVKPSRRLSDRPELRFKGERQLNKELPQLQREVEMADFSNPEKTKKELLVPTVNGQIMRILDMLYANKFADRGKYFDTSTNDFKYPDAVDFYKTMHIKNNADKIPEIVKNIAINEFGIPQEDIPADQVKRVWFLHTLFLNHSMLMPGGAALSDTAYYAGQFIDYAISEGYGGVNSYDLQTLFLVAGKYDRNYDSNNPHASAPDHLQNSEGKRHLFETVGKVRSKDLPKPRGILGNLAAWVTPTPAENEPSLREKMQDALERSHNDSHSNHGAHGGSHEDFSWLTDLPYVVIDKSVHGKYPFMPLPLQYMVFKDDSATYNLKKPNEKKVKRWNSNKSGFGAIVTAADYVSIHGEILYENIPWEDVLENESGLLAWYNNGGNVINMLSLFRDKSKSDLFSGADLAEMKKTAKYGATVIPRLGLEALVGRWNSTSLFDEFIIVYTLGRAIYLLDNHKSIDDVAHLVLGLVPRISLHSAEAILTIIEAGYGTKEEREQYGKLLREQVEAAMKFSR